MPKPPFTVKQLGEVAIRCGDIEKMFDFYRDVVGLEVLHDARNDGIAFFKVCDGHEGHTTVLALFRHDAGRVDIHPRGSDAPETGARSSLHHLALSVDFTAQDAIMRWLDGLQIPYQVQTFDWIGWRGIFVTDPEGNTLEFVAADRSLLAAAK